MLFRIQNQNCVEFYFCIDAKTELFWKVCDLVLCSSHGRALSLRHSAIFDNLIKFYGHSNIIHIEGEANPSMPNASLNNMYNSANIIILLLHLKDDSSFPWLSPSSDFEMIFMILRGDSWCAYYCNLICLSSNLFATQHTT